MRKLTALVFLVSVLPSCAGMYANDEAYSGDVAAMTASIDSKRDAIEARLGSLTRKTLPTADLREQVKQKWSKIEYYLDGSDVVRVKTYPHTQVSQRTEEFYFDHGELMYAFIADRGAPEPEAGSRGGGKEYYYAHGKFVTERNTSGESEHTIRHSDEERLEQEAMEYLELYASHVRG